MGRKNIGALKNNNRIVMFRAMKKDLLDGVEAVFFDFEGTLVDE